MRHVALAEEKKRLELEQYRRFREERRNSRSPRMRKGGSPQKKRRRTAALSEGESPQSQSIVV
jgi:hypothetical protein